MPSTYTVNLGIEKPATGEQSGTWGDTTNVNFDILDQAVNGAARVTLTSAGTSGSPNTLAITNGATSDGRNKWVEFYSSSDLGGNVFVQLDPNDAEKIVFVRNSLGGSQSVILFQGTYDAGRDLEIPAGMDMVVKFDGGGATATTTNVFQQLRTEALNVVGSVTVGGTVDAGTVEFDNLSGTGAVSVTNILDEDTMASNSATALSTQQSIKAYVDAQVGTVDTLAEILANGNTTGGTDIVVSVDDVISLDNGTNALPSLTTTGDLNTGIYFPAADEVGITTGGTQRVIVDSSGNVGIGTSSPSAKLDVVSTGTSAETIAEFGNGNISKGLTIETNGNLDWGFNATNRNLTFSTSQAERMRITSSGNVGIGTSSPSTQLEVKGSTYSLIRVNGSNTNNAGIDFGDTDDVDIGRIRYDNSSDAMQFWTNNAEAMCIDSSGNVGIGISNPSGLLHLKGDTNSNGSEIYLQVNNNNTTDNLGAIHFGNNTDSTLSKILSGTSGANNSSYLTFSTSSTGTQSEAMRITSSGNVGIGTSSPTTALTVSTDGTEQLTLNRADASINAGNTVGTILFTGDDPSAGQTGAKIQVLASQNWSTNAYGSHITFSNDSSGTLTERMRIDNSGNVGIGTSSPSAPLAVESGTADSTIAKFTGANSTRGMAISTYTADGFADAGVDIYGLRELRFSTNVSEAMRIDSSGNVGIGRVPTVVESAYDSVQLGAGGTWLSGSSNFAAGHFGQNYYVDSAGASRYLGNDEAERITMNNGYISFETAPTNSGGAGAALTWSESMRIDASGNVGIGTTSPDATLELSNSSSVPSISFGRTPYSSHGSLTIGGSLVGALTSNTDKDDNSTVNVGASKLLLGNGDTRFYQAGSAAAGVARTFNESMRIDSSGNIRINYDNSLSYPSDAKLMVSNAGTNGMEFSNTAISGQNRILNYNRSTSAYVPLTVSGSELKFDIGASEAMRITSSGNVGIGVTTVQASAAGKTLETSGCLISGGTLNAHQTNRAVIEYNSGANSMNLRAYGATAGSGIMTFATSGGGGSTDSEAMRITSSGRVGIGTTSPTAIVQVGSSTGEIFTIDQSAANKTKLKNDRQIILESGSGYGTGIVAAGGAGYGHIFFETSTTGEVGRFDASGNFLVGTTAGGFANDNGFAVESVSYTQRHSGTGSGTAYAWFIYNGGAIGSITQNGTTAVSYNTTSDYRLKTDAQPMTGASARVQALKPVNFEWIADGTRVDGFLAHEAQAVVPEAVTGEKDAVDADGNPEYQGIDQSKLVPLLTAALQEALTEIADLKVRITALEG